MFGSLALPLRLLPFIALALLCLSHTATIGQDRLYPTSLYSGMNPLTVYDVDGISKIEMKTRDGWEPITLSYKTSYYRVMTAPVFGYCAKQTTFSLWVERIDRNFEVEIRVTDCDGSKRTYDLDLENVWSLSHEDFGTVTLDDKPCHTFVVKSLGGDFIVDKVESPSRQFSIRYPFKKPPLRIRGIRTYRYSVCFRPERLGRIKAPIFVHIRRGQPVGKYTTYVVADTAYVNVIEPSRPKNPDPDPPPITPPPRPKPPRMLPGGPVPPPPPPPHAFPIEPIPGEPLFPDSAGLLISEKPSSFDTIALEPLPEFVHDPTTFRTILTPTARSVGKERGFLASYDVAGIVAGYGPTERLTLIGGGIFVPSFISETFVATLGAKYEFYRGEEFRVAGGIQGNLSNTNKSNIVLILPYLTANWGVLDYSATVTTGYSWRRHSPSDTAVPPFEQRAVLVGLGGDYRFANNWKVAGEVFLLENSEFQPAALTLRWFNNRFAVDGGLAFGLTPDNGLQVLPLLSGVWVW